MHVPHAWQHLCGDIRTIFFCLVCGPLEKEERKNDNWLFFKQLVLTYTIVLVNVLGLDR